MTQPRNVTSLLIPVATIFISSFCIMVLELVASRLIANYLGSSLYTWTAVIGVILGGITIGNYLGGRIADRFPPRKSIAVLFAISSVTCVVTVMLNNIAGGWIWLWHLSWPMHVFTHVSIVFLPSAILLGTISPVVAKLALDHGLSTGRTIGDIYAWGAAGSIAGTFSAGYFLIAAMGTVAIIWTIGAVLLLMSLLYWCRFWPLSAWAVIFVVLLSLATLPAEWAREAGAAIALRDEPDPSILFEEDSRYYHIAVKQAADNPRRLLFYQDRLKHSEILTDDALNLQYFYTKIYAAVTRGLRGSRGRLNVMAIGGGGYVFPRYVERVWPGSRIDVIEIDPDVTKAAMQAFGLEKDTTIHTIHMDARNYVDQLIVRKRNGETVPPYDFIYGDAFNDFSLPFQLVTRQFDDRIAALLGEDGVYMLNLLDIFDSGLFLGAVVNTLEETFPHVYALTNGDIPRSSQNTFVLVAAKRELDLEKIIALSGAGGGQLKLWHLDDADKAELKRRSGGLVLTDDYSPVENLLIPVIHEDASSISSEKYLEQAESLQQEGKYAASVERYLSAIRAYPGNSVLAYHRIGMIYDGLGDLEQARDAFVRAMQFNARSPVKKGEETIHHNLGMVLKKQGKSELAREQFQQAAEEIRGLLAKDPADGRNWDFLGVNYYAMGAFEEAAVSYRRAIAADPDVSDYYDHLIAALMETGRRAEAVAMLKKYIQLMTKNGYVEDAAQLQAYLESLEETQARVKPSR